MKQIRCAIYTRKSSEEGLEQAFNWCCQSNANRSLHDAFRTL